MKWKEMLIDLQSNIDKKSDFRIIEQTIAIVKERWKDLQGNYTEKDNKQILSSLTDVINKDYNTNEETRYKEHIISALKDMGECYADEQSLTDDTYLLNSVFAYIKIRNKSSYIDMIMSATISFSSLHNYLLNNYVWF